jgi:hypothetical protein
MHRNYHRTGFHESLVLLPKVQFNSLDMRICLQTQSLVLTKSRMLPVSFIKKLDPVYATRAFLYHSQRLIDPN